MAGRPSVRGLRLFDWCRVGQCVHDLDLCFENNLSLVSNSPPNGCFKDISLIILVPQIPEE